LFTGIVEEVGQVAEIKKGSAWAELKIKAEKVLEDVSLGDSIAVNGVCLTVTTFGKGFFTADIMHETLNRSSLSLLTKGSNVNLERAMSANGRFGGHIVSGHIDGTGVITDIKKDAIATWVTIEAGESIMRLIVEKGSIAIDGISLTVADVTDKYFKVSLIPHTGSNTTLLQKKIGEKVNLENDVIGKYVERLMSFSKTENTKQKSNITMDFLAKHGF
jgi:riboflavin synthase